MKKKINKKKIFTILIIIYLCYTIIPMQITKFKLKREISQKQIELADLKNKNEQLKSQVDTINSDQFIEQQARQRLGYVREGEKVVMPKTK